MGRKTWAALALGVAASAMTAAPAGAATVTVTGDNGAPAALTPGVPAAIRNMDVYVGVALTGSEQRYDISFTGPAGAATASTADCYGFPISRNTTYQGNGTYTLVVNTYTDTACSAGKQTFTYQYVVNAGTAVTPPASAVLTRKPGSFITETYNVPVAVNPGALSTRLNYAAGAVLGPDGGISGASTEAFVDKTTGLAPVQFRTPGTYTLVAHALAFGNAFTPWSAPVKVRAFSPFDFATRPSLTDDRGPSYKLVGKLNEKRTRGKVKISWSKKKKGRYHSLGKAKIRGGKFKQRFTFSRLGKYVFKYRFKGSGTTAPGVVLQRFTFYRRVSF